MTGVRTADGTITVPLPGGLIVGHRCLVEAELRPLSGREEEWLARHRGLPIALRVTRLLSDCLVGIGDTATTAELVNLLLVGDRDYLIFALRRLTFGDRFQAVLPCPTCLAPMDISFNADDVL